MKNKKNRSKGACTKDLQRLESFAIFKIDFFDFQKRPNFLTAF
nr:MAG TPA: hypothetical protein [Caudoviricetes sp.]